MTSLHILLVQIKLQIVIDSDAGASQGALQQEAVGAIDVVVITDLAETEGGSEFAIFARFPSNTGLNGHSVSTIGIEQSDVTAEVGKQEELVADGAARVADVRLQEQGVGRLIAKNVILKLVKLIIDTQSDGPLVVDAVANFRGKREGSVVFLDLSTDVVQTNPNLGV